MSNAKYFLLGVGMPESRGPSKPSADLPWETKTWNWLCLTLRMASQHLNSHNEEAQKELGTSAPSCPNAAGVGTCRPAKNSRSPSFSTFRWA